MPVSHDHHCLFVHIPKTGGTSIENALNMFGKWRVEDQQRLFGLISSEELKSRNYLSKFLQHLTMTQIQEVSPNWQKFYSFSFVRNPWDRMVSTYSNVDPSLAAMVEENGLPLKELSFPAFVHATQDLQHAHLQPQHQYLHGENGNQLVDYIGRFETLTADFHELCQRLNIRASLPHLNASKHPCYRKYYDGETRAIIADRYQKDIDLFQYDF